MGDPMHRMMNKLMILLSIILMVMKAEGRAQEGQMNEEGKDTVDYMESDRVIADEGKDAFNGMVAAVNSADERVKSFTGELQRAIDRAEQKQIIKIYKLNELVSL
eukprot:TRINITY_DN1041_c0_g1_i2.p1 TRINITY_DN1041_c0_g1~~TRINITY_DN1041_c0_g1_i2.p1  ORF type:complete len:105 (-),score=22.52 TRINITY_DN1041_c0_g1_i2:11-325(-)